MTATQLEAPVSTNGEKTVSNPFDNTMPLALSISMLGVKKKVKTGRVNKEEKKLVSDDEEEGEGDKRTVAASEDEVTQVNKKTIDCEEYTAIAKLAGEIRSYLASRKVPGGNRLFRGGTYPIPLTRLSDVDARMQEYIPQFYDLVQKFLDVYEERSREAMARLRKQKVMGKDCDLSDENDYLPIEKVKKAFYIGYEFVSFGPPKNLSGFSPEMYRREVKKLEGICQQASQGVDCALMELMQKFLDTLINQLTPGKDGKKKKFYDSSVENLRDFLQGFKDVNINNNKDMEALVSRCEKVIEGKDPELFRKNGNVRAITATALESIKAKVNGMLVNAPSRKIVLDD